MRYQDFNQKEMIKFEKLAIKGWNQDDAYDAAAAMLDNWDVIDKLMSRYRKKEIGQEVIYKDKKIATVYTASLQKEKTECHIGIDDDDGENRGRDILNVYNSPYVEVVFEPEAKGMIWTLDTEFANIVTVRGATIERISSADALVVEIDNCIVDELSIVGAKSLQFFDSNIKSISGEDFEGVAKGVKRFVSAQETKLPESFIASSEKFSSRWDCYKNARGGVYDSKNEALYLGNTDGVRGEGAVLNALYNENPHFDTKEFVEFRESVVQMMTLKNQKKIIAQNEEILRRMEKLENRG